jgi:hypothetical protein
MEFVNRNPLYDGVDEVCIVAAQVFATKTRGRIARDCRVDRNVVRHPPGSIVGSVLKYVRYSRPAQARAPNVSGILTRFRVSLQTEATRPGYAEIEAASTLHPNSGARAFFMREVIRLPCEMTPTVSQLIRLHMWKSAPDPLEAVRSDALMYIAAHGPRQLSVRAEGPVGPEHDSVRSGSQF